MQEEKADDWPVMPDASSAKAGAKRRRWPWVVLFLLVGLPAAIGGFGAIWLPGKEFAAPEWLRSRTMERIDTAMPDLDVSVGEIVLAMGKGWRPRVRLRHIDIAQARGSHLVALAQAEAELALRPLVRGQVKPRRIDISGVFLTLQRGRDGRFDLQLEAGGARLQQSGDVATLVSTLDRTFSSEALTALKRAELTGLTVQFNDRRSGRSWTVDGGRLRLLRKADKVDIGGDFALLSGRAGVATLELSYSSTLGDNEATFGMAFRDMRGLDIGTVSPALAWLEVLRAPISGSIRGGVDTSGTLTPVNAALQIGAGAIQPLDETSPVPIEGARAYFQFDPAQGSLRFDDLAVSSEWLSLEGDGTTRLTGFDDGWPDGFVGQLRLGSVRVNPGLGLEEPVALAQADMDFRLRLDPFILDVGQIVVSDADGPLRARASLMATRDGWQASLDGQARKIGPERVLRYWPKGLKPKTRDWIASNILAGRVDTARVSVRQEPGGKPRVHLGLSFADAQVRFMKTMPTIQEGAGHLTIEEHRLSIVAEQGWVQSDKGGRIDVRGTVFEVPDVRIKEGPARVRLALQSTVTAALALLDRKPFEFISKAGQPVTLADGRADVSGTLDLRLKKKLQPKEVAFDINAVVRGVESKGLIPDRVLTASQLNVSADNKSLRIAGRGRVGRVPFDGAWSMALGQGPGTASAVEAEIELSEAFVREFNIGLPPGSVTGAGPGQLSLTLRRDRPPEFRLRSSLAGVGLRLDPLAWRLPRKARGKLEVRGKLGAPPAIEAIALDAPGLSARGTVRLRADGALSEARFDRVRAGNWLDAPVVLRGRGKGASPAIQLRGGSIDMRRLPDMSGGNGQGGPIALSLDRLQVTEGIALTNMAGEFTSNGGLRGEFAGRVNGQANIAGRVAPQGGRSAFDLRSENAGAVLAAAGLLSNVRGGTMRLTLRPVSQEGSYDGVLRAENVRMRDAPSMAALLNAISVVGLLEQLSGQGISFAEVDAKFRLTPTQVILTQSSAIGPSMGLSLDGYYNLARGTMDFQGVLSPIYLLNVVGSVLTRKGEGLIGFNFQLKGAKDKPRVSVNPLSALTPGMFREIFRRPPPKVGQ